MILAREVVVSRNKQGFIIRETHKEKNKTNLNFVYVSAGATPFQTESEAQDYLNYLNLTAPLNLTKALTKAKSEKKYDKF